MGGQRGSIVEDIRWDRRAQYECNKKREEDVRWATERCYKVYWKVSLIVTSGVGDLSSYFRAYINNFQDKDKQAAIDMLLVSCPCLVMEMS